MTLHPEVQRKAQAEIDRVIGNDRFPTLDDQPSLPYLDALMKEVFRWNPVEPLGKLTVSENYGTPFPFVLKTLTERVIPGIPHVPTEDDVYEGYFIPKGISVMANIWWVFL